MADPEKYWLSPTPANIGLSWVGSLAITHQVLWCLQHNLISKSFQDNICLSGVFTFFCLHRLSTLKTNRTHTKCFPQQGYYTHIVICIDRVPPCQCFPYLLSWRCYRFSTAGIIFLPRCGGKGELPCTLMLDLVLGKLRLAGYDLRPQHQRPSHRETS